MKKQSLRTTDADGYTRVFRPGQTVIAIAGNGDERKATIREIARGNKLLMLDFECGSAGVWKAGNVSKSRS